MSEAIPAPAATPAAAPPATPIAAPAATPAPAAGWRDGLSDDLRVNPSLSKFEDVGALAKSYVEAQGLIGKKGIIPPGENATPDQVAEFHKALGRPETIDGYKLAEFQPPEALKSIWDQNGLEKVAEVAFAKGVTSDQLSALTGALAEVQAANITEATQAAEQARSQATEALRKEWGTAFDPKMDLARRGFKAAFGGDYEALAELQLAGGGKLGDHPALVRAFARLGEQQQEHGLLGDKSSPRTTKTPAEASREINTLMADTKFMGALTSDQHPEHKMAMERWNALHEMSEPGETVAP